MRKLYWLLAFQCLGVIALIAGIILGTTDGLTGLAIMAGLSSVMSFTFSAIEKERNK